MTSLPKSPAPMIPISALVVVPASPFGAETQLQIIDEEVKLLKEQLALNEKKLKLKDKEIDNLQEQLAKALSAIKEPGRRVRPS